MYLNEANGFNMVDLIILVRRTTYMCFCILTVSTVLNARQLSLIALAHVMSLFLLRSVLQYIPYSNNSGTTGCHVDIGRYIPLVK